MRKQPGAGVAARTERRRLVAWSLLLLLLTGVGPHARADEGDPADDAVYTPEVSDAPSLWRLTEARFRMSYFDQVGRGYQSQAGDDPRARGDERLLVFQPMFAFGIDYGDDTHHTITVPVDVVSSASADALDAVSSASRVNEAFTVDLASQWRVTDDDELTFNYGFHIEEPFRSGYAGMGYTRWLAQDNASLTVNAAVIADWFDPITPQGFDLGQTRRQTITANVSFTQIMSPTTFVGASYGYTLQLGTLEQTWNVVPQQPCLPEPCSPIASELMPNQRHRHAISGFVAQRIPLTRSTVRARYRLYRDDFGTVAHTARFALMQDLGNSLMLRGHYRFHTQTAPDFWTRAVDNDVVRLGGFRTADSDLEAFNAHEFGVGVIANWPFLGRDEWEQHVELGYLHYRRTTGMRIHAVTVGWGIRR